MSTETTSLPADTPPTDQPPTEATRRALSRLHRYAAAMVITATALLALTSLMDEALLINLAVTVATVGGLAAIWRAETRLLDQLETERDEEDR
ncbi:hypothetical protein V6N00_12620 [Tersicoccus sp. MR15.9]|uniref:hypothetical protein n=1 Tax=Tersicoccus mangrovi TaxID=3121635 RepID=UPI002FE5A38F